VQVVGVDPGIRNTFYARTTDGRRIVMSGGEFDSLSHLEAFRRAQAARATSAGLPDLPPCRTCSGMFAYRAVLLRHLPAFLRVYGNDRFLHDRLTVRARLPRCAVPQR